MIKRFYSGFHKTVEDTTENSDPAKGERSLGNDPKTGLPIIARLGRFGPVVQLGNSESETKPKFASIHGDLSLNSITLEQALDLFKLPKILGKFENEDLQVAVGKFGPYVKHKGKFFSIGNNIDPLEIKINDAISIIEEKRKNDTNRIIQEFSENNDLKILNGKYGPYISYKRKNYKIPKDKDPKKLTLEEALAITAESTKTKSPKKKK